MNDETVYSDFAVKSTTGEDGLSTRARNVLWANLGVKSWQDPQAVADQLSQVSYRQMIGWYNTGKTTREELREFLERYGHPAASDWPPRPLKVTAERQTDLEKLMEHIHGTLAGLMSYIEKELKRLQE